MQFKRAKLVNALLDVLPEEPAVNYYKNYSEDYLKNNSIIVSEFFILIKSALINSMRTPNQHSSFDEEMIHTSVFKSLGEKYNYEKNKNCFLKNMLSVELGLFFILHKFPFL